MKKNCRHHQSFFSLLTTVVAVGLVAATLFLLGKVDKLEDRNQILAAESVDLENENGTLAAEAADLQGQCQALQQEVTDLQTIKGGVEKHGKLTVKGSSLYDEKGAPLCFAESAVMELHGFRNIRTTGL